MDAVLDSVAQHGFERASFRDIAARAGMTHVGLLRHFDSKEELLFAALDAEEERERLQMDEFLAEGGTDREAFEFLLTMVIQDRDRSRRRLTLQIAATDPAHPAHAWFLARHRRVYAEIQKRSANAGNRSTGRFDPSSRALLFLAMVDGLQLEWLMDPDADVVAAAGKLAEMLYPPKDSTI